jgi:hypothetical protein
MAKTPCWLVSRVRPAPQSAIELDAGAGERAKLVAPVSHPPHRARHVTPWRADARVRNVMQVTREIARKVANTICGKTD